MVQVSFFSDDQQLPSLTCKSCCRENNCLEAPDPGDRGQPGFTPNEQSRFAEITAAGGLVDAYRALHASAEWQDCVTWRGAAGKDVAESGRYYNKGMRIDLFMLQESLKDRIEEVEVCGRGPNMEGFLGSDHSPLLLHLRAADPVLAPAIATAASSACVAAETAEPKK
jgi:exonuclease III